MLFAKIKDIKIRKAFSKIEKFKKIRKFILINFLNKSFLTDNNRHSFLVSFLNKTLKQTSRTKVRIVRRCALTNRNRAVLRPYNISRIALRELIHFGLLPGYSKAVW